ncbi:hypothetical protein MKD33_10860, partial [Chromobacterium piscinae]
AALVVL